MRLGITGHQNLPNKETWHWVDKEINAILGNTRNLEGISSLAAGADQLFARAILKKGGQLKVILPFSHYEEKFSDRDDLDNYKNLLSKAITIEILDYHIDDEHSYLAAGQKVVDLSAVLVAVWNGKQALGIGGTADIVAYANSLRKPIIHIDTSLKNINKINF